MFGESAAVSWARWAEYGERLDRLEKTLDRVVDAVSGRLGIVLDDNLSEHIQELLAKDQFEVAVIEYRRETGAGLEAAFQAVQNGGKLDFGTKVDRLLQQIEHNYPAQTKT